MDRYDREVELDRHLDTLLDLIQKRSKVRHLIRSGHKDCEKELMRGNVEIADSIELLFKIMCQKRRKL